MAGQIRLVIARGCHRRFEGWLHEGAGIYRHVWLVKTAPLAIAPDGLFVWANLRRISPKAGRKSMCR